MVDREIIKSVRNYLSKLPEQGIVPKFGVVFGSQATGSTHEWSDIDLIVVAPVFDGVYERETVDRLWHVTVWTDNRIEPIPCGERQWREDEATPIVEIARREGVIVYPESEDIQAVG